MGTVQDLERSLLRGPPIHAGGLLNNNRVSFAKPDVIASITHPQSQPTISTAVAAAPKRAVRPIVLRQESSAQTPDLAEFLAEGVSCQSN